MKLHTTIMIDYYKILIDLIWRTIWWSCLPAAFRPIFI